MARGQGPGGREDRGFRMQNEDCRIQKAKVTQWYGDRPARRFSFRGPLDRSLVTVNE